jgi:hypothetical protein
MQAHLQEAQQRLPQLVQLACGQQGVAACQHTPRGRQHFLDPHIAICQQAPHAFQMPH